MAGDRRWKAAEDEGNVDAHRQEVGLPTLEEYRQQMNQHLPAGE